MKDNIELDADNRENVENFMSDLESTENWQTNPTFRQIFENDMNGIRESKEVIIVFPAGLSAHMELGAAYGMGKRSYGIGLVDKYETLYLMMDDIYADIDSFAKEHIGVAA